jgi:hypothetical protein
VIGISHWALILVGSVYLGWHYAVDGIGVVASALLLWWAMGRLAAGGCTVPLASWRPCRATPLDTGR